MSKFMKIGGKTDNNTAMGVSVSDEGNIRTERKMKIEKVEVLSTTFSADVTTYDTSEINPIRIGDMGGLVSLRVYNDTGVPLTIEFSNDLNVGKFQKLYDTKGNRLMITIPKDATKVIITPEDVPQLSYLEYLKMKITCAETPTAEGTLKVHLVAKG